MIALNEVKRVQELLDSNRDKRISLRINNLEEALNKRRKSNKTRLNTQDHKKRFITLYKISKGCEICGYNEDPLGLDLDHIDPMSKKYSICDLNKKPWDVLFNEVSKCQVLCAICHRYKTQLERLNDRPCLT